MKRAEPPGDPCTPGTLRRAAAVRLADCGMDTPALDARLLMQHVLGVDGGVLLSRDRDAVGTDVSGTFEALVARRAAGEPIAHILGEREFMGLTFTVTPDVLIPRPDSETLVEVALNATAARGAPERMVDFGTGSGCLLVSYLTQRPQAQGIGIDRSRAALGVAKENAARHGVARRALFMQADWGAALGEGVDLVIANPPYIPSAVIAALSPDVRGYEPHLALDGGCDGLTSLACVFDSCVRCLRPGGLGVVEFGFDQRGGVQDLLARWSSLRIRSFLTDLAGRDRGVLFERLAA